MNAIAGSLVDAGRLARLESARMTVARLLVDRPEAIPIFARLEHEIAEEHAKSDPIARARKLMADEMAYSAIDFTTRSR